MKALHRKLRTAAALVRSGRFREAALAGLQQLVRITVLRFDVLEVASHTDPLPSGIPLSCKLATGPEIEQLLREWPDSREEYERHRQVYYEYGFKTWLVFRHAETDEPAHLQVLITRDDVPQVRRVLPWKLYGCVADARYAHRGWVYTFEKYRRAGVAAAATREMARYCRDRGIENVFGHRGVDNAISIRMADAQGFVPYARVYQLQLPWQRRHAGFYLQSGRSDWQADPKRGSRS